MKNRGEAKGTAIIHYCVNNSRDKFRQDEEQLFSTVRPVTGVSFFFVLGQLFFLYYPGTLYLYSIVKQHTSDSAA